MQDTELFALVDNMFKKEAVYVETRDSSAFHAYAIAANRLRSYMEHIYRMKMHNPLAMNPASY